MVNTLKFDLYKMIKSKSVWIILGVSLLLEVLELYFSYRNYPIGEVFDNNTSRAAVMSLSIPIFAAVFSGKDMSTGYIKNVYSSVGKFGYILSKVVVIVTYTLISSFCVLLLEIFFNYTMGEGIMFDPALPVGAYFANRALLNWAYIGLGAFIMLIEMLVKKEYVVALIYVVYVTFVMNLFYQMLGSIFSLEYYGDIGAYLPVGIVNTESMFGYRGRTDDSLKCLLMVSIWFAVSLVGSWLLFRRKKV